MSSFCVVDLISEVTKYLNIPKDDDKVGVSINTFLYSNEKCKLDNEWSKKAVILKF